MMQNTQNQRDLQTGFYATSDDARILRIQVSVTQANF
jgi:hypothetical protein